MLGKIWDKILHFFVVAIVEVFAVITETLIQPWSPSPDDWLCLFFWSPTYNCRNTPHQSFHGIRSTVVTSTYYQAQPKSQLSWVELAVLWQFPTTCHTTQSCKKIIFVRYPDFQRINVRLMHLVNFIIVWGMKVNSDLFSTYL